MFSGGGRTCYSSAFQSNNIRIAIIVDSSAHEGGKGGGEGKLLLSVHEENMTRQSSPHNHNNINRLPAILLSLGTEWSTAELSKAGGGTKPKMLKNQRWNPQGINVNK